MRRKLTAEEVISSRARKRAYQIAWVKRNKQRANAYATAWYWRNRDKAIKAGQNYRKKHHERVVEIRKKSHLKHIEERRSKSREYAKKNRHIFSVNGQNRRARVKAVGGRLSADLPLRLMKLQHGKCPVCHANLKKTGYDMDHIIAITKGGPNIDSNIQLLCPKCNGSKSDKDPIVFMQQKGFLL